ncbi:MAG: thioredoxin domain-containing protein [Deltaproteobacteria bacterium]|nr:thioredoxin domain-containing protein [Deltaproteobacteria bacterium]
MSENSNGRSVIVAAVLVSLSVIGGSFFVADSLDRATAQLERATEVLEDMPLAAAPGGQPGRPSGPDPRKQYEVELGTAPVRGEKNAKVTIVEWSDFQCPFCNRVVPTLDQIEKEYGDSVQIVFKHLPLDIHPDARAAHAAAEAAHRQGKFWAMHDRIFQNQRDMRAETLEGYAKAIGLDMDRYRKDVVSDDVKQRIEEDLAQAQKLGVTGTPAFFINGRNLSGAQPFPNFKRMIDEALGAKG